MGTKTNKNPVSPKSFQCLENNLEKTDYDGMILLEVLRSVVNVHVLTINREIRLSRTGEIFLFGLLKLKM